MFTELKNYDKFKEFEIDQDDFEKYGFADSDKGELQYVFKFPNGYGASVIKNKYSYGANDDLFELAVLNSENDLCYDTEITDDVVGYLTNDDVLKLLERIKNL